MRCVRCEGGWARAARGERVLQLHSFRTQRPHGRCVWCVCVYGVRGGLQCMLCDVMCDVMVVLVEYHGFRLIAMPWLPLHGSSVMHNTQHNTHKHSHRHILKHKTAIHTYHHAHMHASLSHFSWSMVRTTLDRPCILTIVTHTTPHKRHTQHIHCLRSVLRHVFAVFS